MSKLRTNYANVMATIAVFLALGGSAYAVTQLDRNSVKSKHIKNNAVKSKDVKNAQVRSDDLRDGAVTRAKLEPTLRPLTFTTTIPSNGLTNELLDEQGFRVVVRCDDTAGEPELNGSITFPESGSLDLFIGEREAALFEGDAGRTAVIEGVPFPINTGPPAPDEEARLGAISTWVGSTRSALVTLHTVADDNDGECSLTGAIVPLS